MWAHHDVPDAGGKERGQRAHDRANLRVASVTESPAAAESTACDEAAVVGKNRVKRIARAGCATPVVVAFTPVDQRDWQTLVADL